MEGLKSFGSEDLLGLDVKEEGFNGCGGVPFLVEKKDEVLDVSQMEQLPNPC